MASCDIIVDIFHFVFFILCQLLFATSLTFARGPVCILFSPFGLPNLRSLSLYLFGFQPTRAAYP